MQACDDGALDALGGSKDWARCCEQQCALGLGDACCQLSDLVRSRPLLNTVLLSFGRRLGHLC